MKIANFLLVAFLLLAPAERFVKHGPKSVLGDLATSSDSTRKQNNAVTYCQNYYYEYNDNDEKNTSPSKINYDSSSEEKYVDGKKIKVKEAELCSEEVEAVKKAAAKWQANKKEKIKKHDSTNTCKPLDHVLQADLNQSKMSCASESKDGATLCAECEKCEVQIKPNGDGIMLKCQDCNQVPPHEIVFPAGNSRKIIRLP